MTNQINPGELWCSITKTKNTNSIIFLEIAIANINNKITRFIIWFRENELDFVIDVSVTVFCHNAKQL